MEKLATKKEKKLARLIKFPLRALAKARDFYVNSIISCAGQYSGSVGGFTLQWTYSSVSSNANEDLRELIRASSTKMFRTKTVVVYDGGMRSKSVAIGRIDEDKVCEFDWEFVEVEVPRSRSYAVPRRTMV